MKNIFLLCCLLLPVLLAGQNSKKSHFGISASPILSGSLLQNGDDTPISEGKNIFKFGFAVGPTFSYSFSEHWSLRTGVNYSVKNFGVNPNLKFGNCLELEQEGKDKGPCTVVNYSFHFLELPLACRYVFSKKGYYFQPGFALDLPLKAQSALIVQTLDSEDVTTTSIETDAKLYFSLSIGVGKSWKIGNKGSFYIQPVLSYMPVPIVKDLWGERSLYNGSLVMGVGF